MPIFQYLQLQPIDPRDDGTVSDLDQYEADETIDLTEDANGDELLREWNQIEQDLRSNNDTNFDSSDTSQ